MAGKLALTESLIVALPIFSLFLSLYVSSPSPGEEDCLYSHAVFWWMEHCLAKKRKVYPN